jgi:hypothetical protein
MGWFFLLNTGKEQEAGGTRSHAYTDLWRHDCAVRRIVRPRVASFIPAARDTAYPQYGHALANPRLPMLQTRPPYMSQYGYIRYPFREIKRSLQEGQFKRSSYCNYARQ